MQLPKDTCFACCAGEAADAGELLLVLFERINSSAKACRVVGLGAGLAGADLDAVFGLALHE